MPTFPAPSTFQADALAARIKGGNAVVGIMGMGYVGLPLALAAIRTGFSVLGFDTDSARVDLLNRGDSGFSHIPSIAIEQALKDKRFRATADFSELSKADVILIAVPTPLSRQREPDLSYVENSTRDIKKALRPGQLVVLESTTWPGTTREVMKPILEASGLKAGSDFFLAYSPEREDPGNQNYATQAIPKVVGADDPASLRLAQAFYDAVVQTTVTVSTTSAAEAVKLTENIFRSVNIALVNELKVIFERMDIDVWEVIDAAKTKPFGYMPFYPGPGLGGHCIPIDPFYLTWKAREFETSTRFIELAGQINTAMPNYVLERLLEALDQKNGQGLNGAAILIIGLAYKKNVEDTRESPALKLIELIERRGAKVDFHDPFIAEVPRTRDYAVLEGRKGVDLTAKTVSAYDAVVIATDHDTVDWEMVCQHGRLIIDTRNVCARNGFTQDHIVKA